MLTACVLTLAGAVSCVLTLAGAVYAAPGVTRTAGVPPADVAPVSAHAHATEHFACSNPARARQPCYFSTPSDDVRCVWTPSPNRVTCELLSTGRAYRLRPTGHARAVHVKLTHRGETLPTNQMVVFPDELSCQDTKVAMTCNQDEGFGEFKLSPHGSHSA
jgi:hypothetical protein